MLDLIQRLLAAPGEEAPPERVLGEASGTLSESAAKAKVEARSSVKPADAPPRSGRKASATKPKTAPGSATKRWIPQTQAAIRRLASCGWDGMVRVWDPATGQELHTLGGDTRLILSVAFSPDGRLLAGGSDRVRLWDLATGRELRALGGPLDYVEAVAFSPDGRLLASGGLNGGARLWDTATGQQLHTLGDRSAPVRSLAFSLDGRLLASASDGMTVLWR